MIWKASWVLVALVVACGGSSDGNGGTGGVGGAGGQGGSDVVCVAKVCPCTESGIRAAIAEGGGPFTFDCDGPTTVVTEAEIVIDNDVILQGQGSAWSLIVSGKFDHRVFSVLEGVTAQFVHVSIVRGLVEGQNGGGIRNSGTLTLDTCFVRENFADFGRGGGIYNDATGTLVLNGASVRSNRGYDGTAIYNDGTMTLKRTSVSDNRNSANRNAQSGPLSVGIRNRGTATLADSGVSENTLGIYNDGIMTLAGSTVSRNFGGIYNDGIMTLADSGVSENWGDHLGGIYNDGSMTLTNSFVSRNFCRYGSGGIHNDGSMTLTNSTVSGNFALSYPPGGISNGGTMTLTNSTVSGNTVEDGDVDGIGNYGGTLTLTNTLVDNDCSGTIVSGARNIESPGDTCGFDRATDQVNVSPDDLALGPLQRASGWSEWHALLPGSVAVDQIPAVDCVDSNGEPLTTDQLGRPRPETGSTMCDVGAFELQLHE